jgi:hypothetical protein
LHTLRLVLQCFTDTFIIIDALDECTEREALLELIGKVVSWRLPGLRILVTSRREQDLVDGLAMRELDLSENDISDDIRLYVEARFEQDPKLRRWQPHVRAEIETKLLEGAKGM